MVYELPKQVSFIKTCAFLSLLFAYISFVFYRPAQQEFRKRVAKEVKAFSRFPAKLVEKNTAARERFHRSAVDRVQKQKLADQKTLKTTQEKMASINDTKVNSMQAELDSMVAKTFEKQCIGQEVYSQESNFLMKLLKESTPNGSKPISTGTKVPNETSENYDLSKLIQYFEI